MENTRTSDGFIISDAITDLEDRFPLKELLALEYFTKYRRGYLQAARAWRPGQRSELLQPSEVPR